MVRRVAEQVGPDAVLIEGPSDFNERISELFLPHRLPIAIYSYFHAEGGLRRGAYYPFCVYSPEWQAIEAARELGAAVRFIDLPWAEMACEETPSHRYADGELRYSDYIASLCSRLGVDDFDAVWDLLFEIDPDPPLEEFLDRLDHFCRHAREVDRHVPPLDLRREAFMAEQIRQALEEFPGRLLIVTGGFHTSALRERVGSGQWAEGSELDAEGRRQKAVGSGEKVEGSEQKAEGRRQGAEGSGPMPNAQCPTPESRTPEHLPPTGGPDHLTTRTPDHPNTQTPEGLIRGISLTPYSYQRLDSMAGYESGMPSPGFYHHVWENRSGKAGGAAYRPLLAQVVRDLRKRGQMFSAADLIAVETTARGLALLRGHDEVWRRDLVDGIIGGLVKEELEHGVLHPFLAAVFEVFRGSERGELAEGTALPPLVQELKRLLRDFDLEPEIREKRLTLELTETADRERSRFLHRLRGLGIPGFVRTGGTDFSRRDDLSRVWEGWIVRWAPEFEAGCIEASIYGPTLEEATAARLLERAGAIERDAERAALLLLDAALMGAADLAVDFHLRLAELIHADSDFFSLTRALGHLLYLYQFDEALGTAGNRSLGDLLREGFTRGVWLLEALGRVQGMEVDLLKGMRALLETYERAGVLLDLNGEEFVEVLHRVGADRSQSPLMQGAAAGALWTLRAADTDRVLESMRYCSEPSRLGDFLTGLFYLARETAQRHPELVTSVDTLLTGYADEAFLEALPALRLAFSYFTPREKHHMARTLLQALGIEEAQAALPELEVTADVAALVLAAETRLFRTVERYGLRPHGVKSGGQVDG